VTKSPVIVALDMPSAEQAMDLAARLDAAQCRLKVGKELFTAAGPTLVERLVRSGFEVFLDLKFHDIPNTVAGACKAAARMGVWMLNVHALGGRAMMEAAVSAVGAGANRPIVIAVTVLTSMGAGDIAAVGIEGSPAAAVSRLAALTEASGLDGVVCSAQEAALLRAERGEGFRLVTPGIRPAGAGKDDQQRITTPCEAIALGVDYLVIGRPITQAADPVAALAAINAEIGQARAAAASVGVRR